MEDQVPADVVKERYNRLLALQSRIAEEENVARVGHEVEVLVSSGEGRKDTQTHRVSGRAADNRLVHVALPEALAESERPRPGDMVRAVVTHGAPHHLVADSAAIGGVFEIRRTRAGDAWEARERRTAQLRAEAEGKLPVSIGLPKLRVGA